MFIVKTSDHLFFHDDMDKVQDEINDLMRHGYEASEITFISVYRDNNHRAVPNWMMNGVDIAKEFTWDNPPKTTSSTEPREYNSDDFLKY